MSIQQNIRLNQSSNRVRQAGHAIGCLMFTPLELDEKLARIWADIEIAAAGAVPSLVPFDFGLARAAMAKSLAMCACLKAHSDMDNTIQAEAIEHLMLAVRFIDATDIQDVKNVKGVAIDKLFDSPQYAVVRANIAAIMMKHGYSVTYFKHKRAGMQ